MFGRALGNSKRGEGGRGLYLFGSEKEELTIMPTPQVVSASGRSMEKADPKDLIFQATLVETKAGLQNFLFDKFLVAQLIR